MSCGADFSALGRLPPDRLIRVDSHLLRPHWKHKSYGGTVVIIEAAFQCERCHDTGAALGAIIPATTLNHAEYFKTHPELEVLLMSTDEAAKHVSA